MRIRRACEGIAAIAAAVALLGPAGASATTETFTTVATPQDWTSPPDITSARFDLVGGAGGFGDFGPSGKGGETVATLTLSPATLYQLEVGKVGGDESDNGATTGTGGAGGAPGGGTGAGGCNPAPFCAFGGGGGGASIFAAAGGVLSTPQWLLAAGGGGGGSIGGTGGSGGGLSGGNGTGTGAGCSTTGGDQTGTNGSHQHLNGGSGTATPGNPSGVGGGGGGYYGGSASSCGGGGGSGYIAPAARATTFPPASNAGDGSIKITYFTLSVSVDGDGVISGPGIDCGGSNTDCTERFAPDDPFTLTATASPGSQFNGYSGSACSSDPCTTSIAADGTVSASFGPVAAPQTGPETTITGQPPAKTKRKAVTFSFASSDPAATFECSVDAADFRACSSPEDVIEKTGTHTFAVRATAAGLTDPTPAEASWTVKKKKHKHHHHHH